MISRLTGFIAAIAVAATLAVSPVHAQDQKPADAAPAATEAAAPAAAAAPAKAIDNPYGLQAMLSHGDMVSKTVLALLLIMSMGSWYILIVRLWDTSKLGSEAKDVRATFFKKASLADGVRSLKEESAFRYIAAAGVEASEHHEGALTENIDLSSWVTVNIDRAVADVNNKVAGGLGFLATVGSTAPFIGLFGTVWGILQALTAIGVAGQASIDKVAGPVGEALIMTAIGLGVAVPAVLGYNWLVNRNKSVMGQVRAFAADLHGVLMGNRSVAKR
ncbi:MAG: MotA/TolQ/ExbB proton channel family protein [Roseateles sp.]|jgi:biopolymer transport protein ExbB|nr:biopolymer transporter ExbB [Methylibium sp.]MBY0368259.1 MotA/TolQ/ExbB proton channel family protein [Burkholderiaceae bacterium]RTL16781.1 MAG: MotA/TolQ/ExbB proton channel family protein [Burkholderiales bacterium]|mmetsp:Transcript_1404/g.4152  ORF Transcript_1404/g.4152 Transcript_1404/m.4152 type:complete len:275 (+) Transcript_1404:412-1236(+)